MATLEAARAQIVSPRPEGAALEAPQLRVLTCGSVDDGKSTLLGRLLYETGAVFDDQLAALEADSRRWGTQGAERDYALLLDGLSAEREQGITIDIAYRYFSTARRSFILVDSPGHEQYTSNMATGASQADLAIILVDARKGLLPQTRRHAFIAGLLGIRHAVLAVNKMDLVGFDETRFRDIASAFTALVAPLGFASIVPIPISAKGGDNIVARSTNMPWFTGAPLLEHLETVEVALADAHDTGLRLPVQLVLRPNADFRGYAGTIAVGTVRPGDAVVARPSAAQARVARIVTADGDRPSATAGDAVTLTLDREIDVARGDVLVAADAAPAPATRLRATLLWMAEESLLTGRDYALQLGPSQANARIQRIHHAIEVETYAPTPASWLALNGIGAVDLILDRALTVLPYRDSRALGGFILIDRATHQTVALGVVDDTSAEPRARLGQAARWLPSAFAGGTIAGLSVLLSGDLVLAASLGLANMALFPALNRWERPSR